MYQVLNKANNTYTYSAKIIINNKDTDLDSWKVSFKVPNGLTTVKVNNINSIKTKNEDNVVTIKKENDDIDSIWNKGQEKEIDITFSFKKEIEMKISDLKFNNKNIADIKINNILSKK